MRIIAGLASAARSPTEILLPNNTEPLMFGDKEGCGVELDLLTFQLSRAPLGQTAISARLDGVIKRLIGIEGKLREEGTIALLIIMSDGESTDERMTEVLRPLEGLPLQIVIRISTMSKEINDYWQAINSALDIDMLVLNAFESEAELVREWNGWLTYSEPLHYMKEFGVNTAGMHLLSQRQLSKQEIRVICQFLL